MQLCVNCRSEIPDGALYCVHCSSHQEKWKNLLPHLGGIVSLAALLGALITYSSSTFYDLYEKASWKDELKIVSFDPDSLVLLNSGRGSVYVEDVEISRSVDVEELGSSTSKYKKVWVGKVVKPGEFLDWETDSFSPKAKHTEWLFAVKPDMLKKLGWLEGGIVKSEVCFDFLYYSFDNPMYASNWNGEDSKWRYLDARMSVNYVSAKDGQRLVSTESLAAVLVYKKTEKCSGLSDDQRAILFDSSDYQPDPNNPSWVPPKDGSEKK